MPRHSPSASPVPQSSTCRACTSCTSGPFYFFCTCRACRARCCNPRHTGQHSNHEPSTALDQRSPTVGPQSKRATRVRSAHGSYIQEMLKKSTDFWPARESFSGIAFYFVCLISWTNSPPSTAPVYLSRGFRAVQKGGGVGQDVRQ